MLSHCCVFKSEVTSFPSRSAGEPSVLTLRETLSLFAVSAFLSDLPLAARALHAPGVLRRVVVADETLHAH